MNVMDIPEQKKMFYASLILSSASGGLLLWIKQAEITVPPCFFHLSTGLYCPGCGGTRAWTALLHGHFLRSLAYHPVVLYGTAVYGTYVCRNLMALFPCTRRSHSGMALRNVYLYLAAILVMGNWIVKNLLLLFFHLAM